MGRRRTSSAGGTGLLVVIGPLAAAFAAAYKFVVNTAAAISAIGLVSAGTFLLVNLVSRTKRPAVSAPPNRDTLAPSRQPVKDRGRPQSQAPAKWIASGERVLIGN